VQALSQTDTSPCLLCDGLPVDFVCYGPMGLVAIIVRKPKLSMSEWLTCIDSHPELVRGGPRAIVNPFTGDPAVHTPTAAQVSIRLGPEPVGAVEPDPEFEENGELLVYAPRSEMSRQGRQLVTAVASFLHAEVMWLSPVPGS
jgi:hypothetical protein